MTQLVHYCPGNAGGSPAWLPKRQAEEQLSRDTKVMEKLERVDSLKSPAHWPHIGGTCPMCKNKG